MRDLPVSEALLALENKLNEKPYNSRMAESRKTFGVLSALPSTKVMIAMDGAKRNVHIHVFLMT